MSRPRVARVALRVMKVKVVWVALLGLKRGDGEANHRGNGLLTLGAGFLSDAGCWVTGAGSFASTKSAIRGMALGRTAQVAMSSMRMLKLATLYRRRLRAYQRSQFGSASA